MGGDVGVGPGVRWGGWVGGGSGGGGILNISLFGGIEHAMRPNGVFFGLFLVIFDHFCQIGVFGILAILPIGRSDFSIL